MASFDPLQSWIARRPGGQTGTGSADDPYDGSTGFGTPLEANLTCDRRLFLVTTGLELENLSEGRWEW
jgi:hypothetical protein